jgi:transcription antitermination factor NusG
MIEKSWVALELSYKGEEEALSGHLKKRVMSYTSFKEDDIYIPLMIQRFQEPIWLLEGYLFIKEGYGAGEYYTLKQKGLVREIISQIDPASGLISKGVIPDSELKRMVKQVDNLGGSFKAGDSIKIKSGPFNGFEGTVITTWVENEIRLYCVHLSFRSVEILHTVDCLSVEGAY